MLSIILRALVTSPFFAVYGLFVAIRALLRLVRKVRALRAGFASELRCVEGCSNPTVGRYLCATCHAEYVGWVGRCGLCSAGANYLVCSCGLAIPLPWEDR